MIRNLDGCHEQWQPYFLEKNMKKIRLIELFSGIGAQAKALENLNIPFEHYRSVDFDKYAVASYNAVHGTSFPVMDITKIKAEDLGIVDTHEYLYITTYSFPCTDISVAGRMAGYSEDSETRSSLLWQVRRILDECVELPQVLLMENVPQVHSKGENAENFAKWLSFLESKGYCNYWQDLTATDYGIPQSRKRCFLVSMLLGEHDYFQFEKPTELKVTVTDFLEKDVDDKYFLKEERVETLINNLVKEAENEEQTESLETESDDQQVFDYLL